jgi:transposase
MTHISGHHRSQMLLLPEAVDDYVCADNPVRFVDAFVDELDLAAAGFSRVEAKATGRPGYAPADLLKLYIYGYLSRVRSSRRLEMESHRNIEVIWLLRGLKPDFKTIADFRRDNRAAFRSVFREFVLLCRRLDLYGRELLAVDGTRIKAVNNKDRNFTRTSLQQFIRAADERLDAYLRRLDEGDVAEAGTGGARAKNLAEKIAALRQKRGRYGSLLAALERTGESQISLTDPDSRAMAAHTKVGVGYNAQGGVPLRSGPGCLRLSGRRNPGAAPPRQAARFEKDRLQQSGGVPHLSSPIAVHHRPSPGLAAGERGRAGPDGGPPEGQAGHPRAAP